MQKGRLAGTSLAGDEDVLSRALTELQELAPGGADPAQRHADARPAFCCPPLFGRRRDELKRHLHALGVAGLLADHLQNPVAELRGRGGVEMQRKSLKTTILRQKMSCAPRQVNAI